MHGTFRYDLGESLPSWQPAFVQTGHGRQPAATGPALVRSEYGASRANWPLIGFILAAHGVLLAALIMLDVIPVSKAKPAPTIVTLINLQTPPPPKPPVKEVQPTEQVVPHMTAPVQMVQPPAAPAMTVNVPKAPPQPPVIAPPAPSGPVTVGDLGARMIAMTPPRYPVESRRRKEQGTVLLSVLLAVDGSVLEVQLAQSSGHERLDKAALDAVRKWRWSPTIRGGEPVMVRGTVDIPFILT